MLALHGHLFDITGKARPIYKFLCLNYALYFFLVCSVDGFKYFITQWSQYYDAVSFEDEAIIEDKITAEVTVLMEFAWTVLAVVGPSTEDSLIQQVLCAVFLTFFFDSVSVDGEFDFTDEADLKLFQMCAAFGWYTNSW